MPSDDKPTPNELLASANLSDALESDRFREFLDHIPFAIVVSELHPEERIVYANLEFERLTGKAAAEVEGKSWNILPGEGADEAAQPLCKAVRDEDYLGIFIIRRGDEESRVDAWSNVVAEDNGRPSFRLVALAEILPRDGGAFDTLEKRLEEKDMLLRELQHRVKNNLQMITALIRLEARNLPDGETGERFERLAGRIEALGILYHIMSEESAAEVVDLGVYLSQLAAAVMRIYAVEGIRLDLKIESWVISVDVAMAAGLVVNELLTNALKHGFTGRTSGTITLHCLVDDTACQLTVADDGIGFPEGVSWPQAGKLGALMVKSLRQNAKARFDIESKPDHGVRVSIFFAKADALPEQ